MIARKAMDGSKRIIRLENTSHTELKKLDRKRTAVVAVMSPLEVHGPHLPIGQDWFEAAALADRTVERLSAEREDWTFLMLPPMPVAVDCLPHLGSVNYPATLVRDVAYHMLLPFAGHGFGRLAISSFHGGPRHIVALEDAADRLTRRFGVPAVSLFSVVVARMLEGNIFYDAVKDDPGTGITLDQISEDWHAGFVETSIALYLWPELVGAGWETLPPLSKDMDKPGENKRPAFLGGSERGSDPLGDIKQVVEAFRSFGESVEHYRKHTYSGYPAMSSAEHGRLMFEHLVETGKDICNQFLDRGKDMDPHSPLWKLRGILLNPTVNTVLSDWLKVYSE